MAPIRVLVVDDSAAFLVAASALLARFRNDMKLVGTARSAAEGIEMTQVLAPDVVLLDLVMPVMDGLAATVRIKAEPSPPQVFIVTLHDDPEYRRAAAEVGADGFICKAELADAVTALIASRGTGVEGAVHGAGEPGQ